MEKRIEYLYARQPYQPVFSHRLTSLPTGNLINPGIGGGLKLYDVLLPFHGEEKFVEKKKDEILTGSDEQEVDRPNKIKDIKDPKQVGFGEKSDKSEIKKSENNKTVKKIDGEILRAMQSAQIKASSFSFNPTNSQNGKGIQKKKKAVTKFHFSFV